MPNPEELKKILIKALEQNFDLHLQRIDDASIVIHHSCEMSPIEIHVEVSYREVMMRCCAGPSWDATQRREIRLILRKGIWVDALLMDT